MAETTKPIRAGNLVTFTSRYESTTKDPSTGESVAYSQTVEIDLTDDKSSTERKMLRLSDNGAVCFEVFEKKATRSRRAGYSVNIPFSFISSLSDEKLTELGLNATKIAQIKSDPHSSTKTISLPVDSMTVFDSANKDHGRDKGFQIFLKGKIEIRSNARGIEIKHADATEPILRTKPKDKAATYTPTMTKHFLETAINSTSDAVKLYAIGSKNNERFRFVDDLSKFSTEFVMALATVANDIGKEKVKTFRDRTKNFAITRSSVTGMVGHDSAPTSEVNDVIIANSNGTRYILHNGTFIRFESVSMVHLPPLDGDKVLRTMLVFNPPTRTKASKPFALPIDIPLSSPYTGGTITPDKTSSEYKQLQSILNAIGTTALTNPPSRTRGTSQVDFDIIRSERKDSVKIDLIKTANVKRTKGYIEEDGFGVSTGPGPGPSGPGPSGPGPSGPGPSGPGPSGPGPSGPGPSGPGPSGPGPDDTPKKGGFWRKALKVLGGIGIIAGIALFGLAIAGVTAGAAIPLVATGLIALGFATTIASTIDLPSSKIDKAEAAVDAAIKSYESKERALDKAITKHFSLKREISAYERALGRPTLSAKERRKLEKKKAKAEEKLFNTISHSDPSIISKLKATYVSNFKKDFVATEGREPTQEELDAAAFAFVDKHAFMIVACLKANAGNSSAKNAIHNMSIAERAVIAEAEKTFNDAITQAQGDPYGLTNREKEILGPSIYNIYKSGKYIGYLSAIGTGSIYVTKENSSDFVTATTNDTSGVFTWVSSFADGLTDYELQLKAIDATLDDANKLAEFAKTRLADPAHATALGRVEARRTDMETGISAGTITKDTIASANASLNEDATKAEKENKRRKTDRILGK